MSEFLLTLSSEDWQAMCMRRDVRSVLPVAGCIYQELRSKSRSSYQYQKYPKYIEKC